MIKKIFVFLTLSVFVLAFSIKDMNSLELKYNGSFAINYLNNQNNSSIYTSVVLPTIENSADVKSLNMPDIKLLSATQTRQSVVEKKFDERFYVAVVLLGLLFVILLCVIINCWNSRKFTEWNENNDYEQ